MFPILVSNGPVLDIQKLHRKLETMLLLQIIPSLAKCIFSEESGWRMHAFAQQYRRLDAMVLNQGILIRENEREMGIILVFILC